MNIYEIRDNCRSNLNEYLSRALNHIPIIEDTNILDIGCGTGVSVCEIAENFNCRITAVEPNKEEICILKKKIEMLIHPERMSIINDSIETVKLPEKSFNLILAEGLFNITGFEKGLLLTSKWLMDEGYMIIHDEEENKEMKLRLFNKNGFKVINSIELDETIWWEKYFGCIEKEIVSLKKANQKGVNVEKIFKHEISEIKMYKEDPSGFRSIYYIIKRVQ